MVFLQEILTLERKLLLAGFLETQGLQLKAVGLSGVVQSFGVSSIYMLQLQYI